MAAHWHGSTAITELNPQPSITLPLELEIPPDQSTTWLNRLRFWTGGWKVLEPQNLRLRRHLTAYDSTSYWPNILQLQQGQPKRIAALLCTPRSEAGHMVRVRSCLGWGPTASGVGHAAVRPIMASLLERSAPTEGGAPQGKVSPELSLAAGPNKIRSGQGESSLPRSMWV
ncbi:hypothetical protein NDU88_008088 [Pleurodeles waltl]|uniref:Uncharacterized protein n=1 Tax=Pleurodeles waltl TaxID=8319 RepID=A0AAV7RWZ1_PLEWA|nr:hypothetical protein NDU88_008088 [Pleurodeles waltl]